MNKKEKEMEWRLSYLEFRVGCWENLFAALDDLTNKINALHSFVKNISPQPPRTDIAKRGQKKR